ncbi:MAG TPA: NrfD/PsrC family molybdoenzyme membrane anchor subunit [Methylomirabilota bacterium]|nr:NrfD/PsrC family molybdoenzyme membrane anchor subunit [Methylomirabilota bacterium]
MGLLQSSHWPFLIDVYFFLGGLAGGAFVIATIATLVDSRRYRDVVRAGYYLALAALIPCPVILIIDLGVPARFMNMMTTFNTRSPMSMGSWALAIFGICVGLAALFTLLEDLRGRDFSNLKVVVGAIGGVFGFFVAAYPGVLLGATARPLWTNGHALGALFLAVGASTAAAAIALVLVLFGRARGAGASAIRRMTVLSLVVQALSLIVFIVAVQSAGSAVSDRALALLMSGPFKLTFWIGAIVVGTVVPLLLGLADLKARSFALSAVTAMLVLVGGFLVKYVIMAAGQA